MKQFKADVLHWKDYDYTVINDNIEKCYKLILKFVSDQKVQKVEDKYNRKFIKNHINYLLNKDS